MAHNDRIIQEHCRMLGEMSAGIASIKEGQAAQTEMLGSIDQRLRAVESRSARNGLIAGGVMSVGVLLIKEGVKEALKKFGG